MTTAAVPVGVRSTPSTVGAIHAIALNTFREAIRDRILYVLLGFALVLIAVSRLLSLLTVGDEAKIIKDVGLSAISLFGVLTAVFVGAYLVFLLMMLRHLGQGAEAFVACLEALKSPWALVLHLVALVAALCKFSKKDR